MKTLLLRFLVGIGLNVLLCFVYTKIFPGDPKMGYFVEGIIFALIHVLLGILLLLFRSKTGSLFSFFCSAGNGLVAFYFLVFSIDYSEGPTASSYAIFALPSVILFFGLQWKAWAQTFSHSQESL